MKWLSFLLLGLFAVSGLTSIFYLDDMQKMQNDFQAYQTRNLLPEDYSKEVAK